MTVIAVDHVTVAVPDLEEAAEPWRRLGLAPVLGTRNPGRGTENAALFIGHSPETMFYLEFLTIHDREQAASDPQGRKLAAAIEAGGGIFRLVLESDDLDSLVDSLRRAAVPVSVDTAARDDGSKIGNVATLKGDSESDLDPRFIEYALARPDRFEARKERGVFASTFELFRLDHLAMVPSGLDGTTTAWADSFGIGIHGEVTGSGLLIRQMKVGDAIVEFLAPDGPSSRLAGAPPGLRSMIACEVDDLDVSAAVARERGFSPTDPAQGVLPGTRTATIPAEELSGVALQLLEYE